MKTIVIAANLKVWSMSKGSGAPSFYKTIELYHDRGFFIYLYTTEANLTFDEFDKNRIKVIKLPKLNPIRVSFLFVLSRTIVFLLNQILFLIYYLKSGAPTSSLLYGYEIEFIPALWAISKSRKTPLVSRFQGTILYPHLSQEMWRFIYFPHYVSLKINSDLTIMTDDGTKGKEVLEIIRHKPTNILFIKNGIDFAPLNEGNVSVHIRSLFPNAFEFNFITVSRLQKWKRVDRSIRVFHEFSKSFPSSRLIVVGEGDELTRLKELVDNLKLSDFVCFVGGINRDEVKYLLKCSEIFLSHYELSNVGNPLWEAFNEKCLIVTIANGDTGLIVKDGINGILTEVDNYLENAGKLIEAIKSNKQVEIANQGNMMLRKHVVSWDERMAIEFHHIEKLICHPPKR